MIQFVVVLMITFVLFTGMGLALYVSRYKRRGSGCSGDSSCSTHHHGSEEKKPVFIRRYEKNLREVKPVIK